MLRTPLRTSSFVKAPERASGAAGGAEFFAVRREGCEQRFGPGGGGDGVVVDVGDDTSPGAGQSFVAGGGQAGAGDENVAQVAVVQVFRGEILRGGLVRGVVDDDDFEIGGREGLGQQGFDGQRQDIVAVVGADDRGEVCGGRLLATRKIRGGGIGVRHDATKHLPGKNSTLNCGFGGGIRLGVMRASRDRMRRGGYSGGSGGFAEDGMARGNLKGRVRKWFSPWWC